MLEDEHDIILNNNDELFKLFPFLEAFPFDFYEFEFEYNRGLNETSLLDPIIIKAGGGLVEPYIINFTYVSDNIYTTLSFYSHDIKYVHESADKIKKMDNLVKSLDNAIKSSDHLLKIKTIKQGERNLLKKIGSSLADSGEYFNKILDQLKEINEIKMTKSEASAIKSLSLNKIEQLNLPRETINVVNGYLDAQLHHINILLGIIIATKIY